MSPQEKLLKLREILCEEVSSEIISQYYADHPEQTYRGQHPKGIIDKVGTSGNLLFCEKYELITNNGCRSVISSCTMLTFSQSKAYTFMFYGNDVLGEFNHFSLHFDSPESDRNFNYFAKDNHKVNAPYGNDEYDYFLKNEEMLEHPEFKKYFAMFIQDIAPERYSEVQELLA